MIKDILNLLKFKPEAIEYYQKYSLKTMISIMIFISVAYGLLLPHPPEVSLIAHFFMMLMMVPIILILVLFLQVFLKLKHKKPTFQALLALSVLASIIDLAVVPLAFLAQFHGAFDYLQLVVFCYSLLIFFFAFAKANEVGLGFSLLTTLLGTVIVIILTIMTSVIFIVIGLIPAPTLPPV
ncbi:hypothetical protein SPONL_1651 [uncultured Candidatus Thioglobus sp.]|nr:hypothetical protein SPONL_1651 [uncultured Candidatus Thioglobus sp.]